ncbi:fimbrial biogenesis chaperone [Providencia sp. PROV116]|uniref:fimbrial biogenesis chaperone n=1 Tax=Providencia sp. PROV116 TaxID=2949827 RepID=UPI002349ABBF|nr:molecular chaperone [Providencia sp. PROV116]
MNIFNKFKFHIICSALFFFFAASCNAGIMIAGTRLVYEENRKEVSISISNPDKVPYLIQSWLEPDNTSFTRGNEKSDLPFIITPPLFRLNGDASNSLRIVKVKELPNDRESVYWLNIKSIPASNPDAQNQLLISVNSRIKLFYRPFDLLQKDAATAYQHLSFTYQNGKLLAKNPTPFYISLQTLTVNKNEIEQPGMISPFAEQNWEVTQINNSVPILVTWSAINDFGGKTATRTQSLR